MIRKWTWIVKMLDGTCLVYKNRRLPTFRTINFDDGTSASRARGKPRSKNLVAYFREERPA